MDRSGRAAVQLEMLNIIIIIIIIMYIYHAHINALTAHIYCPKIRKIKKNVYFLVRQHKTGANSACFVPDALWACVWFCLTKMNLLLLLLFRPDITALVDWA